MFDRYTRAELDPTHPDADYTGRVTDPGDVVSALQWLVPSAIPAVVFASLAALSVPTLSDLCRIEVTEDGMHSYVIQRPLSTTTSAQLATLRLAVLHSTATGQVITACTVQTSFTSRRVSGETGYHGVVTHLWNSEYAPHAMDAALAQVAVERAVALIDQQRLASHWRHQDAVRDSYAAVPAIRALDVQRDAMYDYRVRTI